VKGAAQSRVLESRKEQPVPKHCSADIHGTQSDVGSEAGVEIGCGLIGFLFGTGLGFRVGVFDGFTVGSFEGTDIKSLSTVSIMPPIAFFTFSLPGFALFEFLLQVLLLFELLKYILFRILFSLVYNNLRCLFWSDAKVALIK